MKNDRGFVPINRMEIMESKLYPHGRRFTKFEAFIDLLFLAAHSETSFTAGSRCVEVKLKRGQLGYSQKSLALRWGWDRKTVRKFIQETLKKEENVDSKSYPEKNPETTIITINSYDYYVRNFEKTDTKTDTKMGTKADTKTDTFNNYKNYENYKKNDNDNDIPENPGCNGDSSSNNFNRELSEKETDLIEDILSWAYDLENNFKIEKSTEETREHIENTIRKHGHEAIEDFFFDCSEGRLPWDNNEDHKSAYSEFWESVQYLKYNNEIDKINKILPGIIDAANEFLGRKFDKRNCRNLKKILSNNATNNDIMQFIIWFKDHGFEDNMTLDDIFSKENWSEFLRKSGKRSNFKNGKA